MRYLITGNKGQLGSALTERIPAANVVGGDLPEFDITDYTMVRRGIERANVDIVIHCAAYTNVDGCAKDPALAYQINGLGTKNIAQACAEAGIPMALVSTNEVFDGAKAGPYWEFDQRNPINGYGKSKYAGEYYAEHLLNKYYIIRTSWLYAAGGKNFIHRIQELADERGELSVVTDELGIPTRVADLADAILNLVSTGRYGMYHLINNYADGEMPSRWDFAKLVLDLSGRTDFPLHKIKLADWKRASTPPPNGVLGNMTAKALGIELPNWKDAVEEFINGQ